MKTKILFPINGDFPCHPCANENTTLYETVSECETDKEELNGIQIAGMLFSMCQNFNAWWAQKDLRSMSVGDIIAIGEKFYRCEGVGWKEVKMQRVDNKYLLVGDTA